MHTQFISIAARWGLIEALIARSLYSIHHWALYSMIPHTEYSSISILMGIIYGIMLIGDLGFVDSIGPWFFTYTANQRSFITLFIRQLCISFIPFIVLYVGAYAPNYHTYPWYCLLFVIIVGLAEHTKRTLRLLLNVAGYARTVALIEGITYISYISIVWSWYAVTHSFTLTSIFIPLVITCVLGCFALALCTYHYYSHLSSTTHRSFSWYPLIHQRAAYTATNLITSHGMHTLALPLITTIVQLPHAAFITCANNIIAAMSTISHKLITVISTITFNYTDSHTDKISFFHRLFGVLCIIWTSIIIIATFLTYLIYPLVTPYITSCLCIYALQSLHLPLKILFDSQRNAPRYALYAIASNACIHLIFYASLLGYLPAIATVGGIISITIISLGTTYYYGVRSPANTKTITPPTISHQFHIQPPTPHEKQPHR